MIVFCCLRGCLVVECLLCGLLLVVVIVLLLVEDYFMGLVVCNGENVDLVCIVRGVDGFYWFI